MALTELPISTRTYDIDGITGIQRDNVKTLMGDTDLTYVVGSPFVVTDGQIIRTRAEGLAYEVAAPGATDQHVTTAGGVKLYILPERHHPSRRQTQKLMQKLERGENCHIVVAGDSTGNENDEWVYVLAQKIAADYPAVTVQHRLWSTVTNDYGAAVTIQTGTGAGTMIVWNASTTGGKPDYFAGQHLLTAFRPVEIGGDPDLVMFSYGHSGSDLIEDQYPGLAVITGDVSRHMPTAPIVLIGQNPNLNDTSMQTKTDAFRALAAAQGYGYIDVHFFFQKYLSPLSGYYDQSDPVHPSAVGSSVWATIAHMAFGLSNDEPVGNLVSSQNRGVVYQAGRYTDLEKLSIVGATRSRSSTEYETSGESMQLTGNGTSGGDYVHVSVITPQDIRAYNGRYVTALVRVKVASGSGANAGRIQLTDGVAEATTLYGGPQGTDWYSQAVSMKVSDDATSLELRVLLSAIGAAGGSTDTIFVDRIVVVDGIVPGDKAIADASLQDLQFGNAYNETDAEMALLEIPASAEILWRLPSAASAGQVAQVGELSAWRREPGPTTADFFTTAGGEVWVQTGLRSEQVLEAINSILAADIANPDNIVFPDTQTLTQFYERLQTSQTDETAGAIYTKGAFGLGGSVVLTGATNLKDRALRPGFYAYETDEVAGGPESGDFPHTLLVLQAGRDDRRSFISTRVTGGGTAIAWLGTQSTPTGAIIWTRLVDMNQISGTVSQSGGLPTGAIIEKGSNANGSYTRWADGTQTCYVRDLSGSASMVSGQTLSGTWTYPIAFSDFPVVTMSPRTLGTQAAAETVAEQLRVGHGSSGFTAAFWAVHCETAAVSNVRVDAVAYGRWY